MPVLSQGGGGGAGYGVRSSVGLSLAPSTRTSGGRRNSGLLAVCANPECASGWLRLWRGRQAPVFEGGWSCGPRCTQALVRAVVVRELAGLSDPPSVHRHRIPLGLLLLSQGAITREQLRSALARQKLSGGRLGMWLEREHGIEQRVVTRALAVQWGCPVLTLDQHIPERVASLVPRLFIDAFGFLPLRRAGGGLLYVGFEDRIDRCACLAIERMTGLRVEAGLVDGDEFAVAHRRLVASAFPPARLVEGAAVDALTAALTRILEQLRPIEARLVRMHDYLWLRMWKRPERSRADRSRSERWRADGLAPPPLALPRDAHSPPAFGERAMTPGSVEDVLVLLTNWRA